MSLRFFIRHLFYARSYCLRIAGLPIEPAPQYAQDRLLEQRWRERVARNVARRRAVLSAVHVTRDPDWIPPYLRAAEGCALLRRQAG